jgi:hypothetical protein
MTDKAFGQLCFFATLACAGTLALNVAAQEAAANPNPLSGLEIESFGATISLPLFTPSRTAPIEEPPPPEPEVVVEVPEEPIDTAPVPPPFKLIGVVVAGEEQVALLLDEATGEIHSFAAGDGYEGWIMQIVDARTVQFQNSDLSHTLAMFEEFEAPDAGTYGQWDPGLYPEGGEQLTYDRPADSQEIDPNTGFPIDPNTGYATDPATGQLYDPNTGYQVDPNTGLPLDPETGQPFDPATGQYYDPETGLPVDS